MEVGFWQEVGVGREGGVWREVGIWREKDGGKGKHGGKKRAGCLTVAGIWRRETNGYCRGIFFFAGEVEWLRLFTCFMTHSNIGHI